MVKILVVDDSSVDRKIAGGILRKHADFELFYATDGEVALQEMASTPVDLVLTDLQMPHVSGLELVRTIRQSYPLIPVILMTHQGSERIAVEALEQGAASYVPKEHLPEMLVNTVRQVLAIAGERRSKRTLMRRLDKFECRFTLNNDPETLTSLVAYLQEVLDDMDLLSESDRLRVGVALEEALLNASYHGNLEVSSKLRETDHALYYELARERAQMDPFQHRSIYVDVAIDVEGIRYTVQDEGPGFDLATLPDPTDPENLEKPCGRGLLLMRTFMDGVEYNEIGNQVTMTKRAAKTTASS